MSPLNNSPNNTNQQTELQSDRQLPAELIQEAGELGAKSGCHGFPALQDEEWLGRQVEGIGKSRFRNPALSAKLIAADKAQQRTKRRSLKLRFNAHQQLAAARQLTLSPVASQPIAWPKALLNVVLAFTLIGLGLHTVGLTPGWEGYAALAVCAVMLFVNLSVAPAILCNACAYASYGFVKLGDQVISVVLQARFGCTNWRIVSLNRKLAELSVHQQQLEHWLTDQKALLLTEYHLHRMQAEHAVRRESATIQPIALPPFAMQPNMAFDKIGEKRGRTVQVEVMPAIKVNGSSP